MSTYSLLNLLVSILWIALGIYSLSQLQKSVLFRKDAPPQWLALATLFFGPVIALILLLADSKNSASEQAVRLKEEEVSAQAGRLHLFDSNGNAVLEGKSADEGLNVLFFRKLLARAVMRQASDIFINPEGEHYSVRFRQDGTIHVIDELSCQAAAGCIQVIKVVASMDISENRRPQDGAFSIKSDDAKLSFRVATVGAYGGEKLSIRLLGSLSGIRSLESLGMSPENLEFLQNAVTYPSGLVLVCGPTGSGKTSTLYAMLAKIDFRTRNVISIEDPIECEIPQISQMEVNPHAGITFASLLRNSLRQNPDVICLGEIRDQETAEIAVQAAQTGHLLLATLHTNDNLGTLARLESLGVDFRSTAEALRLLISQRLVRKLCPDCKEKITLPPELAEYFRSQGLPTNNVHRACGCPKCHMTGYLGRCAIFDVLPISSQLKQLLEKDVVSLENVRMLLTQEHGSAPMVNEGYRLVAQGITSLEEIARVAAKEA